MLNLKIYLYSYKNNWVRIDDELEKIKVVKIATKIMLAKFDDLYLHKRFKEHMYIA